MLWAVNGGIKVTKLSLAMQGALLVRFILGAIFVGVQRPQFEPVCVARNLILPIGVIVMVTDVAMVAALSTKVVLAKKSNALRPELSRNNALIYVTAGLGIWTGVSGSDTRVCQEKLLIVATIVEYSSFPRTQVIWLRCPNNYACYWAFNSNWYVTTLKVPIIYTHI